MPRYRVALHERVIHVSDTEGGLARAPNRSPRGIVRGISRKSRYRLIRYLSKVTRPDEAVFITLSYRDFVDDFVVWKAHLNGFHSWLSYHFPLVAGFWRLEFQQRGAPHFHLLLWLGDVVELEAFRRLVSDAWTKRIDDGSRAHREHGAKVEPVTDFRKTAFYISAYAAKETQDRTDIATGREWGIWGRERLGLEPIQSVDLSGSAFTLFRRVIRRGYVAYCRRSGIEPTAYLRALRADQPFTSFLPFGTSARLALWCADQFEAEPF